VPAYDPEQAFCTEQDVFDYGGHVWTDSSPVTTPSATAVRTFAYGKASELVQATQRAGLRIEPPTSGIADEHLGKVLVEANAKGAAYEAWRIKAAKNPDDFAVQQFERLLTDFQALCGFYDKSGEWVPGAVGAAVESAIRARTISNDVTGGETTLPVHDAEERPFPFRMTDRL
jgi:hypothetical protein